MSSRRNASHDAAWKQFFALPIAVEHLLHGFFPEVAALLDFDTLRDVSGEWVADGRRRRADSVWRVGYRDGGRRSLTLVLEFQATVDRDMAGRVLGMLGMAHRRARRAGTLDVDRRLRTLCIVIHTGRRRWTAPGAAERVAVSADGEVLSLTAAPYAMLDARRHPREHLPQRNVVSTLFGLTTVRMVQDAVAPLTPLTDLGTWLPDLHVPAEPVRKAYAEWLATTMPTAFTRESALELVERLTRTGTKEEGMAFTVLEEQLQRKLKRTRREGVAEGRAEGMEQGMEQGMVQGVAHGMRNMLRGQVARKFGDAAAAGTEGLLAGLDADGLQRAGESIMDCATAEELVERLGNGRSG